MAPIHEFYGDFWHGNPAIYNPDDLNRANHKSYGELYTKTMNRETKLKAAGYKIVSIWENEWKTLRNKNEVQ